MDKTPKTPRSVGLSYEFISTCLEEHLREVSLLLSTLSDHGRPLTADEKSTIREVMGGKWMRDILNEMRVSFIIGDRKGIEEATSVILNTLSDLS